MTTFIDFLPTAQAAFTFSPILDGQAYAASVTWNITGRRYYLNLFALSGVRVFSLPLIGSKAGSAIDTIAWSHGFVSATTVTRHGYVVGATADLQITGMLPDAFNGSVRALVTGLNSFEYPLDANPGSPSQFGVVNYDINLVGGYFETSRLVFREANQRFEISP